MLNYNIVAIEFVTLRCGAAAMELAVLRCYSDGARYATTLRCGIATMAKGVLQHVEAI
jgi:hypothetical protein